MHALTRRAVQSLATIRPWPKGSQLLTNDISSLTPPLTRLPSPRLA